MPPIPAVLIICTSSLALVSSNAVHIATVKLLIELSSAARKFLT